MKDTNFIEILPFDEVEILEEEFSLPKSRFQVVGLSKSRNLVTLGLSDKAGHFIGIIERLPHQVQVCLLDCDPRSGAKCPATDGTEEARRYLGVYQAFVKKRTGDFDEWRALGPSSE